MKCWPERAQTEVQAFVYPAVAGAPEISWEAFGQAAATRGGEACKDDRDPGPGEESGGVEASAEQLRRSFESGRESGFKEGRAAEREQAAAMMKEAEHRRITEAAGLAESFRIEQARYFETVEREVVKLALAVAARILRREAQTDPLLLSGAVRIALGQLSAATQATLRVPPTHLELWKETVASLPNLAVKPRVVGGDGMSAGECVLETELGAADLGISSQLAEIERGLFDRGERSRSTGGEIAVLEEMSE